MNSRIIRILGCGIILTSMSMLSACNTVKGTVQGAGQDIQAVGKAVTPTKHRKTYRKRRRSRTSTQTTSTTANTATTTDKSTTDQSSTTTNVDQTKTSQTTTSGMDDNQPIEKDTTKTEETY